ncbi:hypothetical protein ACTXT7_010241 [Hymenolepis weldensis]
MGKDKTLIKILFNLKVVKLDKKKVVKEELIICKPSAKSKLPVDCLSAWNYPWQYLKQWSKLTGRLCVGCFGKNPEEQNKYTKKSDDTFVRVPLLNGKFPKVKLHNVKRVGDSQYRQGLLEMARLI